MTDRLQNNPQRLNRVNEISARYYGNIMNTARYKRDAELAAKPTRNRATNEYRKDNRKYDRDTYMGTAAKGGSNG